MNVKAPLARLLLPVGLLVAAACAPAAPTTAPVGASAARELVVFAASSLTDPFNELGPAFGAANGATVAFNYAATTQLRTQLEQGARADVFASANVQQMDAAAESGVVLGERPVFAQNK